MINEIQFFLVVGLASLLCANLCAGSKKTPKESENFPDASTSISPLAIFFGGNSFNTDP